MRSRKYVWAVVSFALSVLLLVCSLAPVTASAKSVSQLNSELAELERQATEINNKVNSLKGDMADSKALKTELQNQVTNLESQISVCLGSISQYDIKITAMEKEIEQKNADLEVAITEFKERIRAISMSGSSEMSFLLSADDFADFLAKAELAKSVSAYDKALMETIKNTINGIKAEKQSLEKEKSEEQAVKNTLASKQDALTGKISSVNSEIKKINNQTSTLNSQLSKIQAAKDQYEDEIAEAIRKAQQSNNVIYDGSQFTWPVPGYFKLSEGYGWRTDPFDPSAKEFHKGIDISGPGIGGKPAVAAADGVVATAGFNQYGYGNYVVINHGKLNGVLYTTHYAHLRSVAVKVGQAVTKKTVIGYVGTTGSSTGNHLHFEVRLNGSTVNPMNYFKAVK